MRTPLLLLSLCLAAALANGLPAATPASSSEVWVVQLATGGVVDLHLLCEGDRVVAGFAFETDRNTPWLARTEKLTLSRDGRLKGKLTLTPSPDLIAQLTPRGKKKAEPPTTEELTLDLTAKGGRVTGKITAAKKSATGILGRGGESVAARGWTHAEAPADDAQVELVPLGVGSVGAVGFDPLGGGVVLRLHLRGVRSTPRICCRPTTARHRRRWRRRSGCAWSPRASSPAASRSTSSPRRKAAWCSTALSPSTA